MSTTQPAIPAADLASVAENRELLRDPAAKEGFKELVEKLEPLLAQRRLNRIVDLLSVTADVVDMSDAYMIEKLCKAYEETVAAAWAAGNAVRMAGARVAGQSPPSLLGLWRMASEPQVRRGVAFLLAVAGALGEQLSHGDPDPTEP
ncbi:DUF1641 domain-containing protein [Candidatus Methylocalor cossyra]|uniref:DUF1641 domain-containing protein n=1 Tax=Candidatus Methylocalor cossyra TaxID=3108543 RepID=A0ABP1C8R2_9GAMM